MSPPPILSADVSDTWLLLALSISKQKDAPLRKHPTLPMIQSLDKGTGQWANQMLQHSAMEFVSVEERDICWERLWKL